MLTVTPGAPGKMRHFNLEPRKGPGFHPPFCMDDAS